MSITLVLFILYFLTPLNRFVSGLLACCNDTLRYTSDFQVLYSL